MKKRIIAVALATMMLASVLAGCKAAKTNETTETKGADTANVSGETSEKEAPKEKKEITVMIMDRGQCATEEGTMEQNRWTEWINENSPVKVKWVPVPRSESFSKVNTMFASDSAPDLVWEFGKGFMDGLYTQGVIQPVDDYIEQYSTTYKAYLEEHPELRPYITEDDGKMYAFTSARTPLTIANHGMWIRQDWLDKLGLETPTTVEELYDVAEKFAKNDPDGNGVDDTVGISFNFNFFAIMKALYGLPGENIVIENEKLSLWDGSEGYAQCFEMIKKMYANGVIDKEYVTDTNYERQRQLITTGKAGIYFARYDESGIWMDLKKNCPEANLVPLESVEGPFGKFGLYQEPAPFRTVCMNSKAKDPEAVIQFLDWMLEEGWFTLTYGIEGENYKLVDGVPQAIDTDKNQKELAYAYEYPTLMNQKIDNIDSYLTVTAASDELSQEYAKLKAESLNLAVKNKHRRDLPYTPSVESYIKYKSDFDTSSIEAKMVLDPSYSVEQGVKDLIAERNSAGYEEAVKALQDWYDANKDLLK